VRIGRTGSSGSQSRKSSPVEREGWSHGQAGVHYATRVDLTEARSRQGAPQRGQGRLPHGQPQFGHAAITVISLA
jgi:hypothetical protein